MTYCHWCWYESDCDIDLGYCPDCFHTDYLEMSAS